MTVPPQPTTAPFGFGPAVPGAVPVAAAVPDLTKDAAAAVPPLGAVVAWTEYDVYDEHTPERTRYGVVAGYDATGAAQVVVLGHVCAHFPAAAPEGHTGPAVADLTVIG